MLKTVLSISGRPGLYRLVNRGKNMLIVESISTKKTHSGLCSRQGYFSWRHLNLH